MPKNIIDKIWEQHVVKKGENGDPDIFFIDLHLIHEVTSPQAFSMLEEKNIGVFDRKRTFATIDHSIPTSKDRQDYSDESAKNQVETLIKNTKKHGITLFDDDSGKQGIVHIIGPERGLTQPGKTIVCGDSHTATHGAFGALAFGIGTTQVGHVLASQCLLLNKPKTMKVEFIGSPSTYFSPKDAVLLLIKEIGIQGGTGYALEFCGEYIKNMSMEGRMTICNMAIECGAKSGLVSPDEKMFEYLEGREYTMTGQSVKAGQEIKTGQSVKTGHPQGVPLQKGNVEEGEENKCSGALHGYLELVEKWKEIASDKNAQYDKIITIDISYKKPVITWGTNPEQAIFVDETVPTPDDFSDKAKSFACRKSLEYNKLLAGEKIAGTPVDYVFIGSCTNGRIEDFAIAADILKGKRVASHVNAFFVPGSHDVRRECKELGYTKIFEEAGVNFRMSGCSMCLSMNGDSVPAGKRCISTSNRNFVGRQGVGSYTHLASPLMCAIAAVSGEVSDPEIYFKEDL